jgi:superfamily II DNA or RNA helicase
LPPETKKDAENAHEYARVTIAEKEKEIARLGAGQGKAPDLIAEAAGEGELGDFVNAAIVEAYLAGAERTENGAYRTLYMEHAQRTTKTLLKTASTDRSKAMAMALAQRAGVAAAEAKTDRPKRTKSVNERLTEDFAAAVGGFMGGGKG